MVLDREMLKFVSSDQKVEVIVQCPSNSIDPIRVDVATTELRFFAILKEVAEVNVL